MKIVHRVSIATTPEIGRELARLGISVGEGLATFEVDEAQPSWPEIEAWISRRRAVDVVSTKFTTGEMNGAEWLALAPTWHCGYPWPEDEYLEATYDLSRSCDACGVGAVQRAPFRMSGEPSWGRNELLQLNWVFGEYFAKPELWRRVFEPIGVPCREVLGPDGTTTLETVVQLDVVDEVDVDTTEVPSQTCPGCHRPKLPPASRGFFPRVPAGADGERLVRTRPWFGTGASAYRPVLATRALAEKLKSIRGISLKPAAREPSRWDSRR